MARISFDKFSLLLSKKQLQEARPLIYAALSGQFPISTVYDSLASEIEAFLKEHGEHISWYADKYETFVELRKSKLSIKTTLRIFYWLFETRPHKSLVVEETLFGMPLLEYAKKQATYPDEGDDWQELPLPPALRRSASPFGSTGISLESGQASAGTGQEELSVLDRDAPPGRWRLTGSGSPTAVNPLLCSLSLSDLGRQGEDARLPVYLELYSSIGYELGYAYGFTQLIVKPTFEPYEVGAISFSEHYAEAVAVSKNVRVRMKGTSLDRYWEFRAEQGVLNDRYSLHESEVFKIRPYIDQYRLEVAVLFQMYGTTIAREDGSPMEGNQAIALGRMLIEEYAAEQVGFGWIPLCRHAFVVER